MKKVFLFAICILTSGCDPKSAPQYLHKAEILSDQGNYKDAIKLLDKAIEKDNKYLGAYINRGADKAALGDFKGAIKDYEKVIRIQPNNTLALFNLGNNCKRVADFKTAVYYYNRAFATKGGDVVYMDLKPNALMPDNAEFDVAGEAIFYERGIAYGYLDSGQRAYNDFVAAINHGYMVPECTRWLGYIFLSQGKKDVACSQFKKAMEMGDEEAVECCKRYCAGKKI